MRKSFTILSAVSFASISSGFLTTPNPHKSHAFGTSTRLRRDTRGHSRQRRSAGTSPTSSSSPSQTALSVWWFGGNEEVNEGDDSECELVPVRIERPTPNSRKIYGEITTDARMMDVWAILTDYDELSTHVPNLVESRITTRGTGEQGDGNYQCRLFQKGAQKIIGFEFAASVTMDMKESVISSPSASSPVTAEAQPLAIASAVPQRNGRALVERNTNTLRRTGPRIRAPLRLFAEKTTTNPISSDSVRPSSEQRNISFKCIDSFFFQTFDGDWTIRERLNEESGEIETVISYSVLVGPKGPVPVAALEWRIREDVPTNLRAVKKAAGELGYEGVMARRQPRIRQPTAALARTRTAAAVAGSLAAKKLEESLKNIKWDKDETMAAYLTE